MTTKTETAATTEFDKLIADMDTMAKAMKPADDAKIAAASDETSDDQTGDENATSDDDSGKPAGKKKPVMTKSLSVTLEDGTVVEATDGTELIKGLTDQLGALSARVEGSESAMLKALTTSVALIKAQGEQIASLVASVKALSSEGRGRKAVVTIVETKPAVLAKAQGQGRFNPDEFMAKAEAAHKDRRITGADLAYVEASFNERIFSLPAGLVAKVGG